MSGDPPGFTCCFPSSISSTVIRCAMQSLLHTTVPGWLALHRKRQQAAAQPGLHVQVAYSVYQARSCQQNLRQDCRCRSFCAGLAHRESAAVPLCGQVCNSILQQHKRQCSTHLHWGLARPDIVSFLCSRRLMSKLAVLQPPKRDFTLLLLSTWLRAACPYLG